MTPHSSSRNYRKTAIILFILVLIVSGGLIWKTSGGLTAPKQPIEFRHDVHARDNGIPCLYCHAYARLSTVAGVPSVRKCMVCHLFYAGEHEGVKALKEYWEKGQAIEWIRVYFLPDFVYFSHKRHVRGGVQCQECHGPVQDMEVLTRSISLEMGWCLDCHRARKASVDCLTCHQ